MYLPSYVKTCIDALEEAGFAAYAVGGCVRDSLLGLEPADYDLCTAALPDQTEAVFHNYKLVLAGKKHGTVGVVTEGGVVEITTFRTEGAYLDNRHPEWVEFVEDVTGDLARRDFTVNAMAYSPTRGFADSFGGQQDLGAKILRAVGNPQERFEEDALRILRGMRFSARYQLTPEKQTLHAMLSQAPLLDRIAKERIFDELCQWLKLASAEDLMLYAPVLCQVIPELTPTIGFCQHTPHHKFDVFTHTAHVCAATPKELSLRWAALLHDVGKVSTFTLDDQGQGHFYGHAEASARMADEILSRLKAPTALREEVVFLICHHMMFPEPDRKLLKRWLSRWGAERLRKLLDLQEADSSGKGLDEDISVFREVRAIIEELIAENNCLTLRDLSVNGHDLMALGLTGTAIGACLEQLLGLVLDEQIPNEKAALLAAVKRMNL